MCVRALVRACELCACVIVSAFCVRLRMRVCAVARVCVFISFQLATATYRILST